MKNFNKIWIVLLAVALFAVSCDSLLDVKSERYALPNDQMLNNPNAVLYSMNGLFLELDQLADSYVLLGELRGDLLDVTENAEPYLKAINDINISTDNPMVVPKKYYSVINNCNYIIQTIDTSLIQHAEKVLYRDFAATKAIRAWTYMQLALNFGSAKYYTEPILTVDDAMQEFPEMEFNELADLLIQDLLPWRDIELPENISLGADVNSMQLYFPVRFVLGELYLWKGEYELAANEFYQLMVDKEYVIDPMYQSRLEVENNAFINLIYVNWRMIFDFNETENITMIAGSTEYGKGSLMDTLISYNNEIVPSVPAMNNWNNQTYYHNADLTKEGDLRGNLGSYLDYGSSLLGNSSTSTGRKVIWKYQNLSTETSKAIIVYRVGLLYLRYAEAVNRAGKPNLAFATIKNGLSAKTMLVDSIVPPSEKFVSYDVDSAGVFYDYTNFEDVLFDVNIGVHARGCYKVNLAKDYIIPPLNSLQDSIEYVENKIVEELALETAFEGNRFHDLMRIAIRRNNPSYLAEKVAAKHTENSSAILTKLQDMNNWYLPKK